MKKIILISLSIVLLLSGCIFAGDFNVVSNSDVSESLVSRMRNNIETHTLEGFTRDSTFGDVLDRIPVRHISQAHLLYKSELLGYPIVAEYIFDKFSNHELSLDWMVFSIMPDGKNDNEAQIDALLSKMDAELGDHEYNSDEFGEEYSWDQNNCSIELSVYSEDVLDSGEIAQIMVNPGTVIFGILPKCPEIFPYPFGTDIQTVYQNETPSMLPKRFENSGSLDYEDNGIKINLQFITDKTGNFRLSEGTYDVRLSNMSFKSSLDYFESLADDLKTAVGEPEARGYGIPEVFDDFFEDGYTYTITSGAQGLSMQDILDSGEDDYWLDITWENIRFCAVYVTDASMSVEFPEEYLRGIPAKEYKED